MLSTEAPASHVSVCHLVTHAEPSPAQWRRSVNICGAVLPGKALGSGRLGSRPGGSTTAQGECDEDVCASGAGSALPGRGPRFRHPHPEALLSCGLASLVCSTPLSQPPTPRGRAFIASCVRGKAL